MRNSRSDKIAENYAEAIFKNLDDVNTGLVVLSYLDLVVESMERDVDTWNLFLSKMVASKLRLAFVEEFFEHRILRRLFRVIEMNSRWCLLPRILYYYDGLQLKSKGVVAGTFSVSHSVSEFEKKSMLVAIEKLVGSKVRMKVQEDPSLIGGFSVRVGPWLMENSVRGRLKKIRSLI